MSDAARAGVAATAPRCGRPARTARTREPRRRPDGTSRRLWLLVLALLPLAGAAPAKEPLPSELPRLLALVDAEDPDVRLRARALARRVVLDYYEARAPEGMRLVAGRVVVTKQAATCEGFYLGVHEVTVDEFGNFARTAGLPDRWSGAGAGNARSAADGTLPAVSMSLEEARAYAAAKGARLPTEGELRQAARGGGRLRYPWGDRFDPARVNSREAGRGRPEPVGSRKAGVSVQGIADLLGNVAEWTETPADRHRFVVAGGSYRWYAQSPPAPYKLEASSRLPDVGFRLAKSLPPLLTDAPE